MHFLSQKGRPLCKSQVMHELHKIRRTNVMEYWPEITAVPNASLPLPNPTEVATQVVGNVTMTSPSVYMIFDHLQALSATVLDISCSTSSPLGATSTFKIPQGGGDIKLRGGPYVDAVVSLHPTSLSSLVRDLGPVNTASVVSEIAHGGPSYYYWINAVRGTEYNFDQQRGFSTSVLAKPVDYHNLAVPKAEAYYMNINGAPGCNRMGDHPQCSTIFDGDYRAQLLVPLQVRSLRPEWADCYDPLYGALDPPIALTPAVAIKAPTKPAPPTPEPTTEAPPAPTPEDPTKEPETPAAPGPTVPSKPSPTTPPPQGIPSAVPDTKPDENSDDEPSSDDKPASEDEPASNDEPTSNDKPAPDDKPAPEDEPASEEKPTENDKPTSDDAPAFNDNPTSNDNPASNDQPASDDKPASDPSEGDSPSNTDSSGQSSDSDSDPDDKKPQNALGVLNATPQNDAAKGTGIPGLSGSDESADEQSDSEGNTNDQENGEASGSNGNDSPSTQVVEIDGTKHTVVAQDGAPVIDGTTLAADESPKTIDGQVVSVVDEGVVIGTQTLRPASEPTQSLEAIQKVTFTANSQTLTAAPGSTNGEIIIDGATISAGHAAVTVNGAAISAGSSGFVVDGSTVSYADITGSSRPAIVTLGSEVATASTISSGVFAIGTVTLTAGESGTTISGHTISAGPSGIVVDGGPSSTSATGTQDPQEPQSTGSSSSGPQSNAPSAAESGATKPDVFTWAILAVCSFFLVL